MRRPRAREAVPLPPPPVADTRRDSATVGDLLAQAAERERSGNAAGARELLESALAGDPDSAEAHYRLAGLLMTDEPERARAEYELSRKLDPVRYGETVARILDGLNR
jgi:Tfp pilus assembly protein PilF